MTSSSRLVTSTSVPSFHDRRGGGHGGASVGTSGPAVWGGRLQMQSPAVHLHFEGACSTPTPFGNFGLAGDSRVMEERTAARRAALFTSFEGRAVDSFGSSPALLSGTTAIPRPQALDSPMKEGSYDKLFRDTTDSGFGARATEVNRPNLIFGARECRGKKTPSRKDVEIAEVRALGNDDTSEEGKPKGQPSHHDLMQRLVGRSARMEAENSRQFLDRYRSSTTAAKASPEQQANHDARLGNMIEAASSRAQELQKRVERLQLQVADAERKLERANSSIAKRTTDEELKALSPLERSSVRIKEEQAAGDVAKRRGEAEKELAKVQKKLQTDLIELRDFKVLKREFQRLRLEKTVDVLSNCRDGRTLRSCVREMILYGQERILRTLEVSGPPLENWMWEVLVNLSHIELKADRVKKELVELRNEALRDNQVPLQEMMHRSTQERFDQLLRKTEENMQTIRTQSDPFLRVELPEGEEPVEHSQRDNRPWPGEEKVPTPPETPRPDVATISVMREKEAELAALRRLLKDMRHNIAAIVCHRMKQADGSSAGTSGKSAAWGQAVLSMLVSEDFARATMKEVAKITPQGQMRD